MPPSHKPELVEYLTRSHKILRFDRAYDAHVKFGFFAGQRVQTPKGSATVVGVHTTASGAKQLWFHVDGQDGASFWDNGVDHRALTRDVGIVALEPAPPRPASPPAAKTPAGAEDLDASHIDKLTGMFSTLDAGVCIDALRGAKGDVNAACEQLLQLTQFQNARAAEADAAARQKAARAAEAAAEAAAERTRRELVEASPDPEISGVSSLSSSTDTADGLGEDGGKPPAGSAAAADEDAAARDEHLRRKAEEQAAAATADAIAKSDAQFAATAARVLEAGTQTTMPLDLSGGDGDDDDAMLMRMKALQSENARIEAEKRASMEWCIKQVEKSRAALKQRDAQIARLTAENEHLTAEVTTLRSKQSKIISESRAMLDDHVAQLTRSFAQLVADDNGGSSGAAGAAAPATGGGQ